MHVTNLVFKNISRRKARALVNTIGLILAISVITSTIIIGQGMEQKIGEEIEKYGPNIVITPDSQRINIPYGNIMAGKSTFNQNELKKLDTIPNAKNIRIVSPKLYTQAKSENETLLLVGLNFIDEQFLKVWWKINGRIPDDSNNEALLGSEILKGLNISIGSDFDLNGKKYKVSGFLEETGSIDDYTVYISLISAQKMTGLIDEISVADIGALCSDCPVEDISKQIMTAIPGIRASPILQAVETRMNAVEQATRFSLMLASVVLVAGCFGVMNTMISSVHQRTREIGVFMSLGADDEFIYKIFIFEAILLAIIGGLVGIATGIAASIVLGPFMFSVTTGFNNIPIYLVPLSILTSLITCLTASIYPAWRATKIDPVTALKAI